MSLVVLPSISANEERFGANYKEKSKAVRRWYQEQMAAFKKNHQNTQYLFPKILSNYIYKGPFIEWYVRIKWQFERKNYEFYDELCEGAKRVYDIGCGLGYLTYYLKARRPNLSITGLDYDEEKIELAENCFMKSNGVDFQPADITTFSFEPCDVIFCMDVLHYLTAEAQDLVLNKMLSALNEGGKMIIRDGVVDLGDRHKKTESTEKYSTQILKFNKVQNELHFFSKEYITTFAANNGLKCTIKEQSTSTSNILFILENERQTR